MQIAAFALALLAQAPTPAPQPNGYAIIWGGGATAADADAAMKTWTDAAAGIGGFFSFPAGFPKIVESASVPGLKPGFHVVLLGLCPFDDSLVPLTLAKLKNAGAYGRRTSAASKETCPQLAKGFKAGARAVIEEPDAILRAVVVEKDYSVYPDEPSCEPQHAACAKKEPACPCSAARGETCALIGRWRCTTSTELDRALLLELRDKNDNSLDARIVTADELGGAWCDSLAITSDKASVTLTAQCSTPYCTTPNTTDSTVRYTIKKKRIASKLEHTEEHPGMCD